MTIQAVADGGQKDAAAGLGITVEFSGGLEMLFSNERKHTITIPVRDESGAVSNIAYLIRYLCENLMKDSRKELFVLDDAV
ncbi:Ubiquitin- modifier 1 [Arachnomyces sp. PD_36]|nr:Ubiquitin- modifier 1 [Arachnomyces sp. PD_36]